MFYLPHLWRLRSGTHLVEPHAVILKIQTSRKVAAGEVVNRAPASRVVGRLLCFFRSILQTDDTLSRASLLCNCSHVSGTEGLYLRVCTVTATLLCFPNLRRVCNRSWRRKRRRPGRDSRERSEMTTRRLHGLSGKPRDCWCGRRTVGAATLRVVAPICIIWSRVSSGVPWRHLCSA